MSRDWAEIVFKADLDMAIEEFLDRHRDFENTKATQLQAFYLGMRALARELFDWSEENASTVLKESLTVWDETGERPY